MQITIGIWIIPAILSIFFIYKGWPKDYTHTHGNFSHLEIDNIIRAFWIIPLLFVWLAYFCIMYLIQLWS